ncbi:hypothetical protein Tco_1131961 [Tanacetum coccineum]|uniref:Uncharacterized protein n=1 Tax=Tanacetum coccineum TaxID=301880 RepID=A0ABQ5JBZ0_9ASTR
MRLQLLQPNDNGSLEGLEVALFGSLNQSTAWSVFVQEFRALFQFVNERVITELEDCVLNHREESLLRNSWFVSSLDRRNMSKVYLE